MAVISPVPETKMVDVCKLISLQNLLVRKVTGFVLTTTSAPLILSRAFGANDMTRIAYIYILSSSKNSFSPILISRDSTLTLSNFNLQRQLSLSLSLSLFLFISTSRNSLAI